MKLRAAGVLNKLAGLRACEKAIGALPQTGWLPPPAADVPLQVVIADQTIEDARIEAIGSPGSSGSVRCQGR